MASTPVGLHGCRPPAVRPSPPPIGWLTGFMDVPRLCGLRPIQRLRPALPRLTFMWSALPMEPMVGVLAVAVLDNLVDDDLWTALQVLASQPADLNSPDSFLAGEHAVPVEVRRRLLETLDVFGITQATVAIRRGATVGATQALLRHLSCIDAVVDRIGAVGAQVYYRRMLDAVAELETLAVTDRRVGEFLSGDDTVIARMAAAVDVVEEAGMAVDRCDSAAAHVRRAVGWQRYSRGPVAGMHRACGADIVRGSLRLWSKVACGGERSS